ncbi:MAG TPA: hypothetical protein VFT85_04600 [Acidimicrobiia bacterium]|nr:hypothetical protein [Acidimicrobiia bacterium]
MRVSLAILLAVLLAGCGASDTLSSTSTTATTATSTSTTATTTPSSTTTTVAATSTTIPATTTTLVEGTWAELPLVVYDDWGGIALGWWDGTAWVQADETTELGVTGGEDYRVALLGSDAVIEGSAPTRTGCDIVMPEGLPGVQFEEADALTMTIDDERGGERNLSGVAVSAPWQVTPRPVTAGEPHPDIEDIAIELLADRGYDTDRVELVQSTDADLDGDGAIETVFVAEETELANDISGVYSVVFAVSPSWDSPAVVAESVIPADDSGFPASFRVSAVADLSGDGVMEIVLDGVAWESGWVSVHELTDSGFSERIGAGCGV